MMSAAVSGLPAIRRTPTPTWNSVMGGTLPDAGPNDQARAWIGAIPRDGTYYVLLARDAAAAPAPSAYNLTFSLQ